MNDKERKSPSVPVAPLLNKAIDYLKSLPYTIIAKGVKKCQILLG